MNKALRFSVLAALLLTGLSFVAAQDVEPTTTLQEPEDGYTTPFDTQFDFEWETETDEVPTDQELLVEDSDGYIVQSEDVGTQSNDSTESYDETVSNDVVSEGGDYDWYIEREYKSTSLLYSELAETEVDNNMDVIELSPDGDHVIVGEEGFDEYKYYLYEVETGDEVWSKTYDGDGGQAIADFRPDGERLLLGYNEENDDDVDLLLDEYDFDQLVDGAENVENTYDQSNEQDADRGGTGVEQIKYIKDGDYILASGNNYITLDDNFDLVEESDTASWSSGREFDDNPTNNEVAVSSTDDSFYIYDMSDGTENLEHEINDIDAERPGLAYTENYLYAVDGDTLYKLDHDGDEVNTETLPHSNARVNPSRDHDEIVVSMIDEEVRIYDEDLNVEKSFDEEDLDESNSIVSTAAHGDQLITDEALTVPAEDAQTAIFRDGVTQTSDSDSRQFTVEGEKPDINSYEAVPDEISQGENFSIDYDVSDPNGEGIDEVEVEAFDTGDNSISTVTVNHDDVDAEGEIENTEFEDEAGDSDAFQDSGDYDFDMEVTSDGGSTEDDSTTLNVLEEDTPRISFRNENPEDGDFIETGTTVSHAIDVVNSNIDVPSGTNNYLKALNLNQDFETSEEVSGIDSGGGDDGDDSSSGNIEDWNDLDDIRNDKDGSYTLANDLDEDTAGYDSHGDDWNTIGATGFDGDPFTGTFDGQGYEIEGLTVSQNSDYAGLFGGNDGTIENVGLTDVDISGESYTAGLAGYQESGGVVRNVYVTGDITSDFDDSGGVVGRNGNVVEESWTDVNLDGNGDFGGIVGNLQEGEVSDSYAAGTSEEDGAIGNEYSSTVTDVYWDDTVGPSSSDGGTGLSTSEMQGSSAENNMNFDFSNTWETVESSDSDASGDGYPILRANDRGKQIAVQGLEPVALIDNVGLENDAEPGYEETANIEVNVTNDFSGDGSDISATIYNAEDGENRNDVKTLDFSQDSGNTYVSDSSVEAEYPNNDLGPTIGADADVDGNSADYQYNLSYPEVMNDSGEGDIDTTTSLSGDGELPEDGDYLMYSEQLTDGGETTGGESYDRFYRSDKIEYEAGPQPPEFTRNSPSGGQEFDIGDDVQFDYEFSAGFDATVELVENTDGDTIDPEDSSTYKVLDTINYNDGDGTETYTYSKNDIQPGSYRWNVIATRDSTSDVYDAGSDRSYSVPQPEAPEISNLQPDDNSNVFVPPGTDDTEQDFNWDVESFEEGGETQLNINESVELPGLNFKTLSEEDLGNNIDMMHVSPDGDHVLLGSEGFNDYDYKLFDTRDGDLVWEESWEDRDAQGEGIGDFTPDGERMVVGYNELSSDEEDSDLQLEEYEFESLVDGGDVNVTKEYDQSQEQDVDRSQNAPNMIKYIQGGDYLLASGNDYLTLDDDFDLVNRDTSTEWNSGREFDENPNNDEVAVSSTDDSFYIYDMENGIHTEEHTVDIDAERPGLAYTEDYLYATDGDTLYKLDHDGDQEESINLPHSNARVNPGRNHSEIVVTMIDEEAVVYNDSLEEVEKFTQEDIEGSDSFVSTSGEGDQLLEDEVLSVPAGDEQAAIFRGDVYETQNESYQDFSARDYDSNETESFEETADLETGRYEWYITAEDDYNKETTDSRTIDVTEEEYDADLSIVEPEDGQEFSYFTADGPEEIDFEADVEPNSNSDVDIELDGESIYSTTVSGGEEETIETSEEVSEGEYDVTVTASSTGSDKSVTSDPITIDVEAIESREPEIDLLEPERYEDFDNGEEVDFEWEFESTESGQARLYIDDKVEYTESFEGDDSSDAEPINMSYSTSDLDVEEHEWYVRVVTDNYDVESDKWLFGYGVESESEYGGLISEIVEDLRDLPYNLEPHVGNLGLWAIGIFVTMAVMGIGYRVGGRYAGLIGGIGGFFLAGVWGWFPTSVLAVGAVILAAYVIFRGG